MSDGLEPVRRIHRWLREMEGLDRPFESASQRERVTAALNELAHHADPAVHRLSELIHHVHPLASGQTLGHLLIPLERLLNRGLRDHDFLVTTADRVTHEAPLPLRLALENLRSAFNVGSILRSADGLGVEAVHLCGYTPSPDQGVLRRAALGADQVVPTHRHDRVLTALEDLGRRGYRRVALETAEKAAELTDPFEAVPTVFVLGNERFGLGNEVLAACDDVRRLPLQGRKNSLNVAVIAALAAYEWRRQWQTSH